MRRAQDVPLGPPVSRSHKGTLFCRNGADDDDFELPEEIELFLADEPLENELTAEGVALLPYCNGRMLHISIAGLLKQ